MALGVGFRISPRFRVELRVNLFNGLSHNSSDKPWDGTWNQAPRTSPNLVILLGRYRF